MIVALLMNAWALDPEALRAKDELGMDPAFAQGIRDGLELLYLRRYDNARDHFLDFDEKHPGSGLAPVCDVLVWQALMMENFDFKYDKQYWTSAKNARKQLGAALKEPGNEGWEHFVFGSMVGVEAIHQARQGKYLGALQLGFEAMDHVESSRKAAPNFTDMAIADGMYNFWRTVITEWSSMLPDFGDHKAEGIAQMKKVEKDGLFLAAPATLSLAFSYIEENDRENAKIAVDRVRASYPDNVINNLVAGSVYFSLKKYETATQIFDEVLEDAPTNARARYWRGVTVQRRGMLDEALADFQLYLKSDYMEDEQKSMTHYRIAQVYQRKKEYDLAEQWLKSSIKIDGNKRAKDRLSKLQAERKGGAVAEED